MKKAFILMAAMLLSQYAIPQIGPRLDFTPNIPQSIYQNPANTPWCTTFLALPGLSGINASMSTNVTSLEGLGLNLNDLKQDGFINESVFNQLALTGQDINQIRAGSQVDIFGFGFRKGKHFFAFSVQEHLYTQMNIPKQMLRFPEDQTQGFINAPDSYDLSEFDFSAIHYRPYTFHYAWTAQPGLTVGLQASYLSGKYSIKSFNNNLEFTQPNTNALGFNVDGIITFLNAGFRPDDTLTTTQRDILFKPQNHGFSMGFGMKYVFPISRTELMLSATNLGFIDWKKHIGYSYFNDEMVDKEQNFEEIWDQLFDVQQMPDTSYRQAIPPYFSLAVNQYVARQTAIGVFYQGSPYMDRVQSTMGLSVNTRIKNWMGANLGYVYSDGNHSISGGLSFRAGPVQLYLQTDNLPAAFNLGTARHINSQVGINLIFGDRSVPGLAEWDARSEEVPVDIPAPKTESIAELPKSPEQEIARQEPVVSNAPAVTVSPDGEKSLVDPFHFGDWRGPDEYISKGTILLFQGPNISTTVIDKLNPGDTIRILEQREDDWWLAQTKTMSGWLKPQGLLTQILKPEPEAPLANLPKGEIPEKLRPKRDTFWVITDVPLYEQPYLNAPVLETLLPNDMVILYDKENYKWWFVAKGSRGGWVESLYLAPYATDAEIPAPPQEEKPKVESPIQPAPEKAVAAEQTESENPEEPLNSLGTYRLSESTGMHSGPNQESENITRLRTGFEVELLERTNKYWWKIRYKGNVGYAKAAKLVVD
ncbi:MAG: SH3 domain-containing protein [Saprospiraceae bacterium]|nr:SH3 domain-containing protein [Saprospiraceae bacterium]